MTLADRIGVMNAGRLAQVAHAVRHLRASEFALGRRLHRRRQSDRGPGGRRPASASRDRERGRRAPAGDASGRCRDRRGWSRWRCGRRRSRSTRRAARASDENCFAGRVAEVGYLGGVSIYKVRLDNGLDMKATAANRTRLTERPIGAGDRVWLSFAAGGRRGAAAMTSDQRHRIAGTPRRELGPAAGDSHPGALARRVLPGAVPDRAEDQPVADGDRAAALCAGARSRRRLAGRAGFRRRAVVRQLQNPRLRLALSDVLSAQPGDRGAVHGDPAADRLSDRLWHRADAAPRCSRFWSWRCSCRS